MNIGIFGTGMVGTTIGSKLIALGHSVKIGSRTANNEKAVAWAAANGSRASHGTFADAAAFGEMIFMCTKGDATLNIARSAGTKSFDGKVVIDISNPLDFSKGMPPTLFVCNTDSLGEQLQRLLPDAQIVKTLNIVNCEVMVNPAIAGGEPTMLLSGNDAQAKARVTALLQEFGWKDIIDLGDISTARGTEMMLPIWIRLWAATKNIHVAFKILR